jgi:hypothetical protein
MEVPNAHFMTLRVCPRVSCNVFMLLRHSCLMLHPLMPLPVVIFFLRHRCWIAPWSLLPLLHSSYAQCLFLNTSPFWVLGTSMSLLCLSWILLYLLSRSSTSKQGRRLWIQNLSHNNLLQSASSGHSCTAVHPSAGSQLLS